MRTLAARLRELLDAGLRILSGSLLAVFFIGYAVGALILLPLVALVLAVAAIPGRLRAAARQLRVAGRLLRRAALTATGHARTTLGWWLSLGGR